ncbi:hypothetical protein [Thermococcus sp.]|uniref:hypothetical protein n=1 Tax=Thermococcus sp. TaxID=35749 RepID=UPI0025CF5A28|nr:hypothetical protein [Thermococcus sp.]
MRKSERQIFVESLHDARVKSARVIEQFMKYATRNLNARIENANVDIAAAMRDAVISTLFSFYQNFFFTEKFKQAGIMKESEFINFSQVHFNFPADEIEKIFLSFDFYATIYDPEQKRVTGLVLGEINTYGGSARQKYVSFGLDRIQFLRRGLAEAGSEYKNVKFVYVIIADVSDYDKHALESYAREKGISLVIVPYSPLKSVFDAVAVRVFSTNQKKLDVFKLFIEELAAVVFTEKSEGAGEEGGAADLKRRVVTSDELLDDFIDVVYVAPAP